ncbi:HU family DNA-binding protein [Neptunicoccus sediminis]|uniref:HU family DNA-binding protein n=1 Tax=Neptunicoccus sediminis TaxID=1892596 RepID=UPI0012FF9090|nr:HU family DNA-binding protein [Neptunicoccus sediminis]
MATPKTSTQDLTDAEMIETGDSETVVETVAEAAEFDGKIRKKDIYNHVTVTTGLRKREVREAVDATLAYFHKCLSEGHDLQVPPLGKIRSIARGEGENAKLIHKVMLQNPKSDKKDDEEGNSSLADPGNAD